MTKQFTRLFISAALASTAAFAQLHVVQVNGSGSGTFTLPDPATIVADQVSRLTTLLDLTTSQASQATTIFTNSQTTISSLQTTLMDYETSLQTAIENSNTSTIDSLAAQIGTAQGQIEGAQAKAAAEFYAILTATQKTKLQSLGLGILGGFGGPKLTIGGAGVVRSGGPR